MLSVALLSALLLPLAGAFPVDTHPTFRLRPDLLADAPVGDLGFLPTSVYYPAENRPGDLHAFYDTNTKTVNATNTESSDILFLRPTHGTPMYFVRLGDPFEDAVPALTLYNWKIVTRTREEDGKNVERDWLEGNTFLACGSGGTYNLYGGPEVYGDRCSKNFALEIVWDEKDSTTTTTGPTTTTTTTPVETTTTCDTTTTTPTTTTSTTTDCSTTTTPPPTTTCDTPTTYPPTTTDTPTTTPPPSTTTTTTCTTDDPIVTIDDPTTTIHTILPTGTGSPLPPANTTVPIPNKPTLKPTESPESDNAAASVKAGGLVVAVAVAVAFMGL